MLGCTLLHIQSVVRESDSCVESSASRQIASRVKKKKRKKRKTRRNAYGRIKVFDLAAKWIPNRSVSSWLLSFGFGVSTSFGLDKVELRFFFLSFFLFVSWLDRGAVCLRGMRRDEGGDRQEIACANLINENTIDKGFKFGPHERLV